MRCHPMMEPQIQGASRLRITAVKGDHTDRHNLEPGMELVPRITNTVQPSEGLAPTGYDGQFFSVTKRDTDGEYAGICKIRAEDGRVINAYRDEIYVDLDPIAE